MNRAFARGLALAALGTGLGVTVSGRMARRAEESFREGSARAEPIMDGLPIEAPFVYHCSDGMNSLHAASLEAVADSLPTDALHPVRLRDGRAVVYIGAYHYRDYTYRDLAGVVRLGPPYGEVLVGVLVTRQPTLPVVPLALGVAGLGRLEAFVLHLPVTARLARDVGRLGWGLPKFVADMDLEDDITTRRIRLSDDGTEILSLVVRSGGLHVVERQTIAFYSVRKGALLRTTVPSIQSGTYRFGGSAGELTIGEGHPVADDLRRLDLAPRPLLTQSLQTQRLILPAGTVVGEAGPYPGYLGRDRAFGRFTVRYPGTGALDVDVGLATLAADAAATVGETPAVEDREMVPA